MTTRFKRSEKGLLTPDNCVLTQIDLQPQMLFGVANFDRQTIINNNVALSKAARLFDIPVVLSTVETKGFSGYRHLAAAMQVVDDLVIVGIILETAEIEQMLRTGGGAVVNTSSIFGLNG